jgi:hypothetical protein
MAPLRATMITAMQLHRLAPDTREASGHQRDRDF